MVGVLGVLAKHDVWSSALFDLCLVDFALDTACWLRG
jgi:hypothetical protein